MRDGIAYTSPELALHFQGDEGSSFLFEYGIIRSCVRRCPLLEIMSDSQTGQLEQRYFLVSGQRFIHDIILQISDLMFIV